MSIYYKYVPDGTKIVVLYYFDDCVYWYTSEALGKNLDALVNISHLNFLGNAHWFISIRISCMKDHSISVDQTRYATSIVDYLDVSVVKISKNLYRTTLPYDIIFTKSDASTSDEQVGKLTT